MSFIGQIFPEIIDRLEANSQQAAVIGPETVYQPANLENRALVNKVLEHLILPESSFENMDSLVRLAELSRSGKSCLILMEHYSNFDIPNLCWILEQAGPVAEAIANQTISIAGAKLNEESLFARAFTEAYGRIVIYPSRSMNVLREKGEAAAEELARARAINMAALHQMVRLKHAGHIILVFPSGTRYRPGDEDTRRGLKEIDSYIKSFDYVLFIGIAGNVLRINAAGNNMSEDLPAKDIIIFLADEIVSSQDFRASVRPEQGYDPKQAVADAVMARLAVLHDKAETIRSTRLNETVLQQ